MKTFPLVELSGSRQKNGALRYPARHMINKTGVSSSTGRSDVKVVGDAP